MDSVHSEPVQNEPAGSENEERESAEPDLAGSVHEDDHDLRVLDALESDLLAVERALENLDAIPSGGEPGESGETTEERILRTVPAERFAPVPPTQS